MYSNEKGSIGKKEFILMMSLLMAIAALPIDAILPALPEIAKDVVFYNAKDIQYVIGSLMLGATFGQIIYGPLSDSFGRKFSAYVGLTLYVISSMACILTSSSLLLILYRFLQGFGVVSARVVVTTIVRDLFKGTEMAKLMSLVVGIFIFVPAIAPALGQLILEFYSWQYIFIFFIITTFIMAIWMHFRLPETIHEEHRREFSFKSLIEAFFIVVTNKVVMIYLLIGGISFGVFLGFLIPSQIIYHEYFGVGKMFALYFSISAVSIAVACLLNSRVVHYFPLMKVAKFFTLVSFFISALFVSVYYNQMTEVPLPVFVVYISSVMFCAGFIFGNVNALAMEPLGKVAGMASSVIGVGSNLISVIIGTVIGQMYDGTLMPLVLGFLIGYGLIYVLLLISVRINKKLENVTA